MSRLDAAKEALKGALDAGADSADALSVEALRTTLQVRKGELETSREAETRGVGVRAFREGRLGIAYTTSTDAAALRRTGAQAAELARIAGPDAATGLPDADQMAEAGALVAGIEDPAFDDFDPEAATEQARACEAAAFAYDERISNSEESGFDAARSRVAIASSAGFEGAYARTRFSLHMFALSEGEDGILQRDGWWTASTHQAELEGAEEVGREAARRCLRRLGWQKVDTREVPVVLSPEVAGGLAAHLAKACSGDQLVHKASFLAGKRGDTVASTLLTLVDDPGIEGGLGSRPFDAEGVRPERCVLIENGVLRSFLLDSWSLRRLRVEDADGWSGDRPGNAMRGLQGTTSVGTSNLEIVPGDKTPEELIAGVDDGFYVTTTMGFGVNVTTGDFSQGAAGLWIRNGKLDHAVQEVTIASDLPSMMRNIDGVGSDLDRRRETTAPTIRIAKMMVSGS